MRNGFNTAGFSEVVHEIEKDPAEAKFVYSVQGRRSGLTGLSVQVLPALLGTVKAPRHFTFSLKETWVEVPQEEKCLPSPKDLFLTGVGACMMTTLVGGASARHLALEGAELDITPMHSDVDSGSTFVSAKFTLATESEDERCEQLVRRVAQQSPNYVTLTSKTPVVVSHGSRSPSGECAVSPLAKSYTSEYFGDINVTWISGTQCLAAAGKEGPGFSLRADAPKQLTGVDWGPNPQEYLLAGLAAEIASLLFKNSTGTLLEGRLWEVVATGIEDVRGFLGTDPEIDVGLQDIEVFITSPTDMPEATESIVSESFAESGIAMLLAEPIKISLSWNRSKSLGKLALRPGVGE